MNGNVTSTTIDRVAAKLEGDIRQRGLRPGDRYLTAAEASKVFDVSSMTMHRAMMSLADRELLVRQRSRGTFVGPKFRTGDQNQQQLDVLHLVMAMDYHRTQSFTSDTLVDEFSQALPGVTVQVHHLVEAGAERYIDQIVSRIGRPAREGFVLMRCTRRVQLRVANSGLPAVVYGQAYPGVELPCVQHDQASIGRQIAEYALRQGAARFALLTHAHWRFGDHQMIDAATATLAAAGVSLDSVKMRSLPPERDIVIELVEEAMAETDAADAFLCRNDFYAGIVSETIALRKTSMTRCPCVVSGSHAPRNGSAGYARVASTLTLRDQIDHLAKLLAAAASSSAGDATSHEMPDTVVIPVELAPPIAVNQSHGQHPRIKKPRTKKPRTNETSR